MYRDNFRGTAVELKEHVTSLKLPDDIPAHEAIRAFMLANMPRYGNGKWQVSVTAESADNLSGNRMAAFISIAATEL